MARLATTTFLLGLVMLVSAACGGSGGVSVGFVDLSQLDPSSERYMGVDSPYIFENGITNRINAAAAPVHDGMVSIQFQDVEQQEIRYPNYAFDNHIRVAGGGTYVFHAWFQGVDLGGGATVGDVTINFLAAFYIGSNFVDVSQVTPAQLSSFGAWEMLSFVFHVPFGVDGCYVSITALAPGALDVDLYLDDFSLERVD